MTMPSTASACDREAAWLSSYGDGLPALLKANGGHWDLIQAYWPGAHLDKHKRAVYVTRQRLSDRKSGGIRVMPRHTFTLRLWWPVKSAGASVGKGLAETEQRTLDLACADLLLRIRGFVLDKSHGARFLSAGQTPTGADVEIAWDDAEATIPVHRALIAQCVYFADDFEQNG